MPADDEVQVAAPATERAEPPRDGIRAVFPGLQLREASDTGGMPTLVGNLASYGQWARIDSLIEGQFYERVEPGAFSKTIAENRDRMRVTFNHGKDPSIGHKPLGPITVLEERDDGVYYEVPLLDTSYNRDLVPALQAGLYGSSYRFQIVKANTNRQAAPSPHNPEGWPERTVREVKMPEFGPVTFPAYSNSIAGVRSITDEVALEQLASDPERMAALLANLIGNREGVAAQLSERSLASLASDIKADPDALQSAIDKLSNGSPLQATEASLLDAAVDQLGPADDDDEMMKGENALQPDGAERTAHSDDDGSRTAPPPADLALPGIPTASASAGVTSETETPVPLPSTGEDREENGAVIRRTERPARITELRSQLDAFTQQHDGVLSRELDDQWESMVRELRELEAAEVADRHRREFLQDRAVLSGNLEATVPENEDVRLQVVPARTPTAAAPGTAERSHGTLSSYGRARHTIQDIYSLSEIRHVSNGYDDELQILRDCAMRAVEAGHYSHMDRSAGQAAVERTMNVTEDPDAYIPRRILLTGNPVYRRALHRTLMGQMLNQEEAAAYSRFQDNERAMGQVTGSAGGFGVTFDLDPTMIQTSTGAIVPFRRACRVETITTNEWRGVTSGGVVAAYAAEAAVATDNSPTLAQPAAIVQKAHCFVPFSMEIQGDYQGLEAELGREISDAKDVLEAVQFVTGAGTTVFPQGLVTGASTTQALATTGVVAAQDIYNIEVALSPRFRQDARWFANRMFYNRIRAIDTAGGAQLWTQNLSVGLPTNTEGNTGYRLLGYPAEEASGVSATLAGAGNKVAVFGASKYFVIVDRVGLNLELVPILTQQAVAGTGFAMPTGQRGLYAWWRNTSKVLNAAAFVTALTV